MLNRCPVCNLYKLKCVKTMPVEIGIHELECSRVSDWKCLSCGSQAKLYIPIGRLVVTKKNSK